MPLISFRRSGVTSGIALIFKVLLGFAGSVADGVFCGDAAVGVAFDARGLALSRSRRDRLALPW